MARFLESTGFRYEREVAISFCGDGNGKRARVDFVVYREWGVCILEVDEQQHKHYPVECETARMTDILGEQVKAGRMDKICIVRFNPDGFNENGKPAKVPLKARYDSLRGSIFREPAKQFTIRYLFYDQSSPYPEVCLDPAYPRELRELVEV